LRHCQGMPLLALGLRKDILQLRADYAIFEPCLRTFMLFSTPAPLP
jgi:hypothetical protein